MAELPLEPMMAKLVLSAPKMDCLDEAMHAHTRAHAMHAMHARRSFVRQCAFSLLRAASPPAGNGASAPQGLAWHIGTRTWLTAPTSAPGLAWLCHAVGPQILSIVSLLSIDSVFFTPPSKRQLVEQVKQRFASLEGVCSPGADVASPDPVAGVAAAQSWPRCASGFAGLAGTSRKPHCLIISQHCGCTRRRPSLIAERMAAVQRSQGRPRVVHGPLY
jgi:hypothetical protein